MPKKGDVHVTPGDDGWRVKAEGASRARSIHDTQAAAWDAAREVAKQNKSEAFLHGRDGRIRERNTYRRDPHPPAG